MYYFPITPTCARPFLTYMDESFDDDLTCQLSEIIKINNLMKNFSLWVWSPLQRTFNDLLFISTIITTTGKKEQVFCLGPCIRGDKWHTEEKRQTCQKTFMWKKVNQGARTVLGGNPSLKIDQIGIFKDVFKALTKSMVANSLNYDLAERLIREK